MELVSKIIQQSVGLVSSKPSSAFAFAMVICKLDQKFPDVYRYFLYQIMEECPFIIPKYPKKKPDQSEQNYLETSLKYQRKMGSLEDYNAYKSRMIVCVRLFAAVLSLKEKSAELWSWLARICNLTPVQLTPAILIALLEYAGSVIQRAYKGQFSKLLRFIKEDLIRRFVGSSSLMSLVFQLEHMIDQVLNGGFIKEPKGRRQILSVRNSNF
eukprot:TRINITY_DN10707_c0_g1_i2.p1 TRINITY_DN10707_c0_g1~~TRINITY_DN10707_c0_g1_i2.p1  ORF type:complete len:212 (-),score=28.57 TRINITY_DN10707_c0_g1_i2:65-700(-)